MPLVVASLNAEASWGHNFARQWWCFCQESEGSVKCFVSCCPLFSTDAAAPIYIAPKKFLLPKPFKEQLSRRRVNTPPPPTPSRLPLLLCSNASLTCPLPLGRWEKFCWGGGLFEISYPLGGGLREQGSRDKALIKWQPEDQPWLRNLLPRRNKFEKRQSPHDVCLKIISVWRRSFFRDFCWGTPDPPPPRHPSPWGPSTGGWGGLNTLPPPRKPSPLPPHTPLSHPCKLSLFASLAVSGTQIHGHARNMKH